VNIDEAVAQYREQRPLYDRFTRKLKDLLEELLLSNQLEFGIEARAKDVETFREKISRNSYTDPFGQITDLSGVRIVLHRLSDIAKVKKIIKTAFAVDYRNSKDKKEDLRVNQFGYRSIHFIVSIQKNRTNLPEWQPFRNIKAEIQVRTDLQHVWATFSHRHDYKNEADMPSELRRRLFGLSALFELSDAEIESLSKSFEAQIKIYKEMLKRGDAAIELNVDSLRAFVDSTKEAKYWIRRARDITGRPIDGWGNLSADVRIAEYCKLKTTRDIQKVIKDAHGWGEKFISNYFELEKSQYARARRMDPSKNGIISGLIVARYAERFTDQLLENEFGFPSSPILSAALKARVAA
jgi:ppGpp synthetase/RelA/SpoT-type nucleotidyltranferase